MKTSGEKRSRLERSKNITEREKSRAKREKKIIVRKLERMSRKLVWSRVEKEV